MGSTARKLQVEVERTMKSITLGIEEFDAIWNKVYDTENQNQKEKYEADLKKEIKKLQRFRDQVKTWAASPDIKDKSQLLESRKVIETRMERFKECEKETKTKAFSKAGLGAHPKSDPKEKARSETREWLNELVSGLTGEVETWESEIETLAVKKGKAKPARLVRLEASAARHKLHVTKLEQILRLVDNEALSPEDVTDIKEVMEDYLARNQDDFDEFEGSAEAFYEALQLTQLESDHPGPRVTDSDSSDGDSSPGTPRTGGRVTPVAERPDRSPGPSPAPPPPRAVQPPPGRGQRA